MSLSIVYQTVEFAVAYYVYFKSIIVTNSKMNLLLVRNPNSGKKYGLLWEYRKL